MAGGRASRAKGSRVERELAKALTEAGIPTRRVIGSGAHGHIDSRLTGDLQVGTSEDGNTWKWVAEVKARKGGTGFATLDQWLGDNDILLLKRNNAEPTAYLPWRTLVSLLKVSCEVTDGHYTDSGGDMPRDERLPGEQK
jgi:hypothetical protein